MDQNSYYKHFAGRKPVVQRRANTRADTTNAQFLANLSAAIRNQELLIHYQPRYDILTGQARYMEALVRWERPQLGVFYPYTFLKAAEENGLIFAIDLWVFEQCCNDLIWLRKNISNHLKIAVNISSLDCESVYYSQKLIDLCKDYHLTLSDFEFEISETQAPSDIRKVIAFCKTLGAHGARFCLDSFGTGHASLTRLLELPVNSIKIDHSFVAQIGETGHSEQIISQLLKLARSLDLTTIAGGVEHKYQYDFLTESGCDQMQGFYFAAPKKLTDIKKDRLFIADDKKFRE